MEESETIFSLVKYTQSAISPVEEPETPVSKNSSKALPPQKVHHGESGKLGIYDKHHSFNHNRAAEYNDGSRQKQDYYSQNFSQIESGHNSFQKSSTLLKREFSSNRAELREGGEQNAVRGYQQSGLHGNSLPREGHDELNPLREYPEYSDRYSYHEQELRNNGGENASRMFRQSKYISGHYGGDNPSYGREASSKKSGRNGEDESLREYMDIGGERAFSRTDDYGMRGPKKYYQFEREDHRLSGVDDFSRERKSYYETGYSQKDDYERDKLYSREEFGRNYDKIKERGDYRDPLIDPLRDPLIDPLSDPLIDPLSYRGQESSQKRRSFWDEDRYDKSALPPKMPKKDPEPKPSTSRVPKVSLLLET